MLEDEFNHDIKDKISIQAESIFSSYNASVQLITYLSCYKNMSQLYHHHPMN